MKDSRGRGPGHWEDSGLHCVVGSGVGAGRLDSGLLDARGLEGYTPWSGDVSLACEGVSSRAHQHLRGRLLHDRAAHCSQLDNGCLAVKGFRLDCFALI